MELAVMKGAEMGSDHGDRPQPELRARRRRLDDHSRRESASNCCTQPLRSSSISHHEKSDRKNTSEPSSASSAAPGVGERAKASAAASHPRETGRQALQIREKCREDAEQRRKASQLSCILA